MGRDTGAGAARLERLLRSPGGALPGRVRPGPGAEPAWSDLVPPPPGRVRDLTGAHAHAHADPDADADADLDTVDGARHAAPDPPTTGWRLAGVPTGLAVAAVVVAAVVAVLLLGVGTGAGETDEVLVGPPGAALGAQPAAADASTAAGPGPPPASAAAGPAEQAVEADVPRPTAAGVAGTGAGAVPVPPAPTGPSGPLVVHVDGAVARPGVVSVPAGSRVSDAVSAAGGVTPEADTRLVNLARLLVDGELVVVPVPGEALAAGGTGPAGAAGAGAAGAVAAPGGAAAPAGPVDLNAADAAGLDALPGIGPVLAQRIVAHRDEVGPFASVDDLDAVSGIGPSLMADLRDLVTV